MAFSIPKRGVFVADRAGLSFNISHSPAASSSVSSASSFSGKCCGGTQACVELSLRSPTSASLQLQSPYGHVYSPYSSVSRNKNFSATSPLRGISLNDNISRRANSPTLIDIEDSGNGSITFRYGAAEDVWAFDRLLEFICSGAFKFHNAEYFVSLVIELFGFPASKLEQRRLAKLLSSYVGVETRFASIEVEKFVSSILAEEASKFLPPASVGTYRKGGWRPRQRFTSRHDEWWRSFDNDLGVGDESFDVLSEQSFQNMRDPKMQPLWGTGNVDLYSGFKPKFSPILTGDFADMFWGDSPTAYAHTWVASPAHASSIETPRIATVDLVQEQDVRVEDNSTSGDDFLRSAGDEYVKWRSAQDVKVPDSHFDPFRMSENLGPLPIASIQALVDWEQDDVPSATTLPAIEQSSVKISDRKDAPRRKSKRSHGGRGSSNATKVPKVSGKKNVTVKVKQRRRYDVFFAFPLSNKWSGVATFLEMRKAFPGELSLILHYIAVGLAAMGLAATLHVVARMLSVNATFDIAKMFGIIRGASLVCLSAAVEGFRNMMLSLPPHCSISDLKDKRQLLDLQQRLRRLTSTAMTVMVLMVIGHGI